MSKDISSKSLKHPRLPDVSILIPAKNEEAGIEATVKSCLDQPGISVEVLVRDDASTDRTAELAREAGATVFIAPQSEDQGQAMNKLWDVATGTYVTFMAGDDTFDSGAVTDLKKEFDRLIEETGRTNYFLYGDTMYYGLRQGLWQPGANIPTDRYYVCNPICSVLMTHRQTVLDAGVRYIESKLFHAEDWGYLLRLVEAGFIGHYLPRLVMHYNYYRTARIEEQIAGGYKVLCDYFPKFRLGRNRRA